MGSVVHIITVGTSLLSNTGGSGCPSKNVPIIVKLNELTSNIKKNATIDDKLVEDITDLLLKIDPATELKFRGNAKTNCQDRFPQELSYLLLRQRSRNTEMPQREEVYLLPTSTNDSLLCAEVIRQYITQSPVLKDYYDCKEIKPIDGIDTYNGDTFQKEGIKNLFSVISEIVDNNKDAHKIYLNITGGYKAIVPYSTLQGMLYSDKNVVICYLYEDSPNIIEIPAYPIGLDFQLWHRNSTRLKMVMEGKEYFRQNLDKKISNVLSEKTLQLDNLGMQLKGRYNDQLKEDPLEVYSKEIIKLLLPDEDCKEFRKNLYLIIEKAGVLIWTGDKVPEMVEHAPRHHHHLLEFAEMLLTPILKTDKDFLNPSERFCLLAGILLHDCGHSLDYMEADKEGSRIPLFPGEIRDYHQLLTAQRLNNEKLAQAIAFDKNEIDKLNPKLTEAVIDVCLYHRKKMPFFMNDNVFENPFANRQYESLESKCDYYAANDIDIMKVVALMRVIDGCDIQTRRAGKKEQVEITMTLLREDYNTAYQRAVDALSLYESLYNNKLAQPKYFDKSDDTINLSKDYMPYRIGCLQCLKSGTEDDKNHAQLWLMTAELIDRAAMKHRQEAHYEKHQCVKEVMIALNNNPDSGSPYDFDVTFTPTDYMNALIDKEKETMKDKILNEMRGELDSVKRKMDQLGITINYKCNDHSITN